MNLIKNAFVYFGALPNLQQMTKYLEKLPYKALAPQLRMRTSFVPNPITAELVTPIEGGYSFTYRKDEKILPASVVNAKFAEEVRLKEIEYDRKLDRAEKQDLKESIEAEMLRVALIKTTHVDAFWHQKSGVFIISTGGAGMADLLMGDLSKVCDGVEARKVKIDDLHYRLTNRLLAHIENEERAFGDFELGSYVQLKGEDGNKATFETDGVRDPNDGISEASRTGCQVERIELTSPNITFRLTKDFAFKSLRYAEVEMEDAGDDEDVAGYWRHEAYMQVSELTSAVTGLCTLFEYVPGQAKDEPADGSDEDDRLAA